MKIKTLNISNFRNIKSLSIDMQELTMICGANALGKSNIINSLYWLLSGELITDDGEGRNDLKTIKPTNDTRAIVEVEIELESGTKISKQYFEKWTKKRGTTIEEFKGHETVYRVNDAVVSEKDYIANLYKAFEIEFNIDVASSFNEVAALTDPLYLTSKIDYKILRIFLLKLVGEITDEEVFTQVEKLRAVEPILTMYLGDVEKARSGEQKKLKGYNDDEPVLEGQINVLKTKIDEVKEQELTTEINKLKTSIVTTKNEIIDSKVKEVATARETYNNAKSIDETNNVNTELEEAIKLKNTLMLDVENQKQACRTIATEINNKVNERSFNAKSLETAEIQLSSLEKELVNINNESYTGSVCPNCSHQLDADYESNKELRLSRCKQSIEETRTRIEEYKSTIAKIDTESISKQNELNVQSEKLNQLNNDLTMASENLSVISVKPFDATTQATKELKKQLDTLEQELTELKANEVPVDNTAINNQINTLEQELNQIKLARMNNEKASELEIKLKDLIANRVQVEIKVQLLDEFVKTKIKMLNDKVSNSLGGVEFTMLEEQVNGGLKEVCYPTLNGVTFNAINTSDKLLLGIRLIEGIKKFANVNDLPIIFDRAESIDKNRLKAIESNSQKLVSVVSDETTLKVVSA